MDQQPQLAPAATDSQTRVALADRHLPMREALASALEEQTGLDVVASAGSWQQLIDVLSSRSVDVVLLDYALVAGTLAASIRGLLRSDPTLPIIVMAMSSADPLAPVALKAGARDFLLKDGAPGALVESIRRVARDQGAADARTTTEAGPVLSPHERPLERP